MASNTERNQILQQLVKGQIKLLACPHDVAASVAGMSPRNATNVGVYMVRLTEFYDK